jgi:tRNA(Arg) A34 adenosine deaminase TadA
VAEIASVPKWNFARAEAERHQILALALMALMEHYWNGNKEGFHGEYRGRDSQAWPEKTGLWLCKPGEPAPKAPVPPTDYLGHNIGAIAVDGNGEIIDFEFNHNELFDSSAEHAESRLVRRVFSLAQIGSRWNLAGEPPEADYSTRLSNVTVYTSLESCAQCSGIMTLGRVKQVIYLQKDYGMFAVGNILYNLTHDPVTGRGKPVSAPAPVPAADFGLEHYGALDAAYHQFFELGKTLPFFGTRKTQSVAAFLCTDAAYNIYKRGAVQFEQFQVTEAEAVPETAPPDPKQEGLQKALTNAQVLAQAKRFVEYAKKYGNRGTSH